MPNEFAAIFLNNEHANGGRQGMETVATTCPFCGCGCALYLQAVNGNIVGVSPSEHHPVSQGRLCARGWGAHEAPTWGERLVTPMIRRDGKLEPASWPEALTHVVDHLSALLAAGKDVGVLGSARATNEENYLAGKLARAALGTGNIDFCMRAAYDPMVAGVADVIGHFPFPASLEDIERSDLVVLIEGDLARTHPRAAFSVMKAIAGGAKLVTVGAVKTQLSRLAALHVPALPGGASEIINGLLKLMTGRGSEDEPVIAHRYEGYEALRRSLSSTPVTDSERQVAEWLASASRVVFVLAQTGASRDQVRRDAAAVATLAAVTGHLNRPGSGLLPLAGRCNSLGAIQMGVAPDRLPGGESLHDKKAQDRVQAVWKGKPFSGRGLDAEAMVKAVKGLVIVADDPTASSVDGKRLQAALSAMEFVVLLDAFATSAVAIADVVLPVASFAESEGTYTNMEGRVQRVRAAADPPNAARPGWEVLAALIAGFHCPASYRSGSDVLGEIAVVAPAYAEIAYPTRDIGWGMRTVKVPNGDGARVGAAAATRLTSDGFPYVLAIDDVVDWGRDPLIGFSPTLNRDFVARRKRFPGGVVEMALADADRLGFHEGRKLKIASAHGEVVLPVAFRTDLEPGLVLVPVEFREYAADALGSERVSAVSLEQV